MEKAEALVHLSYEANNEKRLLIDLHRGVRLQQIATIETLIEVSSAEELFCKDNLRETANNNFLHSTIAVLS